MKIAVFGTKSYDRDYLLEENKSFDHQITFFEANLGPMTATLANGFDAVCAFVNDQVDRDCINNLSEIGVKVIALRCAGFNNVDLDAAASANILVARVPEYSPHGVAEHAVALILALNRKIHRSHNRVREGNFLLEGLLGFNLFGKTAGVIGTGKIGEVFCEIMRGFGCKILAYDLYPNENCINKGVNYVELPELLRTSDIISLHCPLTPDTYHLINDDAIATMKDGAMLINTSRGALVDTIAVIKGLKSGKIGHLGLDVYEEEGDLFFEDISDRIIEDDVFARLLTFSNVLITGHQAFFTHEALSNIANTTLQNLTLIEQGKICPNLISNA